MGATPPPTASPAPIDEERQVRLAVSGAATRAAIRLTLRAGLVLVCLAGCRGTPAGPTQAPTPTGAASATASDGHSGAANGAPGDAKDLVYKRAGDTALKLDLYAAAGTGTHPLIVWVHGGGWQTGDKSECLPARLRLMARGYAVGCVDYRLSAQAVFPAQIEDVRDAIAFLRRNAGRYGLDPHRFVGWGDSAGGHLVSLAGATSGQPVFTSDAPASALQAVVDYYGPIDLYTMATTSGYTAHAAPDSPESRLLGGAVLDNPDKARRASPLTYVSAGDPPFLIVHGTADPTVPPQQSQLFYDALRKAGVPAELHFISGAKHGGPEFAAQDTIDLVLRFFDQHL